MHQGAAGSRFSNDWNRPCRSRSMMPGLFNTSLVNYLTGLLFFADTRGFAAYRVRTQTSYALGSRPSGINR